MNVHLKITIFDWQLAGRQQVYGEKAEKNNPYF
jgi:hypothetical protein